MKYFKENRPHTSYLRPFNRSRNNNQKGTIMQSRLWPLQITFRYKKPGLGTFCQNKKHGNYQTLVLGSRLRLARQLQEALTGQRWDNVNIHKNNNCSGLQKYLIHLKL